tara:strand:- start:407 stop:1027 length:621 start_codon:yes stop_codon:yes gene_type:complete
MKATTIWVALMCGILFPGYGLAEPSDCNNPLSIVMTGGQDCPDVLRAEAFAWKNSLNQKFKYQNRSARVRSLNMLPVRAYGNGYGQRAMLEINADRSGEYSVVVSVSGPFKRVAFDCPGDYCHLPVVVDGLTERLWIEGRTNGTTVFMNPHNAPSFLKQLEGHRTIAVVFPLEKPYGDRVFVFNVFGYRNDRFSISGDSMLNSEFR